MVNVRVNPFSALLKDELKVLFSFSRVENANQCPAKCQKLAISAVWAISAALAGATFERDNSICRAEKIPMLYGSESALYVRFI